MKIYNVITPKIYNTNGEQRTIWIKAGVVRVIDKDCQYLEWSANPNVTYKIVEQNEREDKSEDGETIHAPRPP